MPKKSSNLLELVDVSKEYVLEGEVVRALSGASLTIKEGEFVAVVGPSGSGKSTLLHLMGLLDTPSSGQVYLDGQDVSNLDEDSSAKLRNKRLGFVFQQFNLLPRTSVLENVLLPTLYGEPDETSKDRAVKLLTDLGMGERLSHLSNQLSGGQQQRVAIARALINDPSIIFADEPTGNLDSKSGRDVIRILEDLHKSGRTVVIVTHDEGLAKLARRRIRVFDGVIV